MQGAKVNGMRNYGLRFCYRAWDRQHERYEYNIQSDIDGSGQLKVRTLEDYLEDEDYVVEQCTGLADKEGTIIYEGDRVYSEKLDDFGVIRWDDIEAKFILDIYGVKYDIKYFDLSMLEVQGSQIEQWAQVMKEAEKGGNTDGTE